MRIVSNGENAHGMSNPIFFFFFNKINIINLSPAELAQRVVKAYIHYDMCAQRILRSAYAYAQSDQNLFWAICR